MMATTDIQLSEEQLIAVDNIRRWYDHYRRHHNPGSFADQMYRFGGYAGTGKTTVIKFIIQAALKANKIRIRVCAFTGKACNVLQRKGVDAQTMHSLMYYAEEVEPGVFEFFRRHKLEGDPQLVIVDEASMVSTDLFNDLMSFGVPVLFVGDPGQLEPVGDNPNLMKDCDYVLKTIHRQAADSPILRLATNIRFGGIFTRCSGDSLVVKDKPLSNSDFLAADIVLCGKNATRGELNDRYRRLNNFTQPMVDGEKIIVLRNNTKWGVFNGMILTVDMVTAEWETFFGVQARDEQGRKYKLKLLKDPFITKRTPERVPRDYILADYAYAITVHKSQGSEWDNVLVYDEYLMKTDMKRWRYTAITRAAKKLTYLVGR
jgi:exodeoxyribonuclease-5